MAGKKKKRRDGRKIQGDQGPIPTTNGKLTDEASQSLKQEPAIVSPSKSKSQGEPDASPNLVEIVEPLLSLAVPQVSPCLSEPLSLPTVNTSTPNFTPPITTPAFSLGEEPKIPIPSFVFSAGQNSATKRVAATPAVFSAHPTESTTVHNARNSKQYARRREGKCPPSHRVGKVFISQQLLEFAARQVAFGQGRDPLSLLVSYEENALRRIVKVPEGCTSDTIVDGTLRQAIARKALDCAGWQEALNHPKDDGYFAYSTAPEGLTVAEFREMKGKILVTPLSPGCGLLKLKEEAEKKRKSAEEKLEKVKEYLQRLQSDDEKLTTGDECSEERVPTCARCKSMKSHLQDLLKIVTEPQSGDTKKVAQTTTTDVLLSEYFRHQAHIIKNNNIPI